MFNFIRRIFGFKKPAPPLTEESYWRSQAKSLGFSPDEWEEARDYRNAWFEQLRERNTRVKYEWVERKGPNGVTVRYRRKARG